MMKCIISQFQTFSILPKCRFTGSRTLPSPKKSHKIQEYLMGSSSSSTRSVKAAASPIFIAAAAGRAYGGRLSVLVQTGGVLLFAYWIANFIVPGLIMKDLQKDEEKEEKEEEDDPSDDY